MTRAGRKTRKARSATVGVPAPVSSVPQAEDDAIAAGAASTVYASNMPLHELFEQQARNMLDSADLDEEQKQSILVAMACPCCGAGGMSYSFKLKRE